GSPRPRRASTAKRPSARPRPTTPAAAAACPPSLSRAPSSRPRPLASASNRVGTTPVPPYRRWPSPPAPRFPRAPCCRTSRCAPPATASARESPPVQQSSPKPLAAGVSTSLDRLRVVYDFRAPARRLQPGVQCLIHLLA